MQNKKLLIIIGAVVLVVVAGIFAFAFFKNKNSQNGNLPAQQNSQGQNTTGTGTVTQTPPPAAQVGFNISQNPSQPYTSLKPRQGLSDQVAVTPKPVLTQPENQNPPTISSDDVTNPDYSNLSDTAFLNKYYPGATGVVSGASDPAIQQLNAQDPVLIDNPTPPTISVNPNVSTSLFKVTPNTDPQSDLNFVTQLSNTTTKFDIVNNPNIFTDAVNDPAKINSAKAQAQSQISAIEAIPVPQNMLGMSQDYVAYYQAFNQFLTDYQNSFTGNESEAAVNHQAAVLQDDMTNLTSRLSQVNSDIITAQTLVQ